jgi:hypothetical protein
MNIVKQNKEKLMLNLYNFKLEGSKRMKIESNSPSGVKEFTYAKNCHYLKLIDDQGKEIKLVEQYLIRYWCISCSYIWYSMDDKSKNCPCCQKTKISQIWMKPQVSLVPETETDFQIKRKK